MIYTFSGMYSVNHCLTWAWYLLLHPKFLTLLCPIHIEKNNLHCFSLNLFFSPQNVLPKYSTNLFPQISGIKTSPNSSIPQNIQPRQITSVFSLMNLPSWREVLPLSMTRPVPEYSHPLHLLFHFQVSPVAFTSYQAWVVFDLQGPRW